MAIRILILDDEQVVLNMMKRALSKSGYEVTAVSAGPEFGTALLSEARAPFDLIIMDLHVHGSSPDEVIAMAREKNPARKVLFVSGTWPPSGEVGHFLQKPFLLKDLRKAVKELLDEAS